MFAHRALQNLWRQFQEISANRPHQDHGPFDKTCDLGQQASVLDHFHAARKGDVGGVVPDRLGTVVCVQHHKGAFELGLVIFKTSHLDRIGGHEPMAIGHVARGDSVQLERHHFRAILGGHHANNRMQRTDPFQRPITPAHRLGPREIANGLFQNFRDNLSRWTPRFFNLCKQDRALGGLAFLKLVAGQTGTAQKPLDGFFRRVRLGAFAFLNLTRGGVQHPLNRQRQTARRRESGGRRIGQTSLDQPIGHQFLQVFCRAFLHAGGNFLREQFDQQVWHGNTFGLPASGASLVPVVSGAWAWGPDP